MRFGPYLLKERLGAGGISTVYRAVLDRPGEFVREVALKRLRPELSRDPEFARMLAAEARLSARLHHPGIAQVFDFGHVSDEQYLVMELVAGHNLAELLGRCTAAGQRPPLGVVVHIVCELATALAYAHELSDADGTPLEIVHRDVSPSNVMILPDGDVKLIDFGIARAAAHLRDDKTATGLLKGKLGYLSPEQAAGNRADRRSDLFALGIVMYEALTVQRLFRGADALDTLRLVREAVLEPPSRLRPEIAPGLEAIVMRLLARDPAARFQSGHEVVHALRPWLHELEGDRVALREMVASLPPAVRPTDGGEEPTGSLSPAGEAAVAPRKSSRTLVVAVAAAAIAVAGALGVWAARRAPVPPAPVAAPASDVAVAAPASKVAVAAPAPTQLAAPAPTQPTPPAPTQPAPPAPTQPAPPTRSAPARSSAARPAKHPRDHALPSLAQPAPAETAPAPEKKLPELQRPFE